MSAAHQVSAHPALPPSCIALLDHFGVLIRTGLDASGIAYTPADVHAVMHEHAPAIASGLAEMILLMLPNEDDEDEGTQVRFDLVMSAVLESDSALLRRSFEEFGPADESALVSTLDRAEVAMMARLQTLADAMGAGGTA